MVEVQRIKDVVVNTLDQAQLDGFGYDVLTNAEITQSGSSNSLYVVGIAEVDLLIQVSSVSGSDASLQFSVNTQLVNRTIQFIEPPPTPPPGFVTNSVTGSAITFPGSQSIVAGAPLGDTVWITWSVSGTNPVFSGVYVRLVAKGKGLGVTLGQTDNAGGVPVTVSSQQTAFSNVYTTQLDLSSSTATQLPNQPCQLVELRNDDYNTSRIFFGGAGVTVQTGFPIIPGQTEVVTITNLNVLYAIAETATQTLDIIAFY
jgi:hypothetical protein